MTLTTTTLVLTLREKNNVWAEGHRVKDENMQFRVQFTQIQIKVFVGHNFEFRMKKNGIQFFCLVF